MFRGGTDCEREVALAKLKDFCAANDLDLDAILARDEDPVKWRKVAANVLDQNIRTIVVQIAMMVLDRTPLESSSPSSDELWVECTEKQLIEINVAVSVLLPLFMKDVKNLMVAFVIQNRLYPSEAGHGPSKPDERPAQDMSDIDMGAVLELMDGVSKGTIRKQIKG